MISFRGSFSFALVLTGAVLVAPSLLEAQGRGAGRGGGPEASPVAQYRQNIMTGMQSYQRLLNAVAESEAGAMSHVVGYASGLNQLAVVLPEAFPVNSDGEGSRASAEIWAQTDVFAERIAALQSATGMLVEVASSGDAAALSGAMEEVGASCTGCHREFRLRPGG